MCCCSNNDDDSDSDEEDNLNMTSALAHVAADTLRSVAVMVAGIYASVSPADDSAKADAIAVSREKKRNREKLRGEKKKK